MVKPVLDHNVTFLPFRLVRPNYDRRVRPSVVVDIDWVFAETDGVEGLNHGKLIWGKGESGSLFPIDSVISRNLCYSVRKVS